MALPSIPKLEMLFHISSHRAAGEVQIPWQLLDVVLFEGTGEKRNWPQTCYVWAGPTVLGQQLKKSIAPAGSLSPPWYGRRTQCCEWMAECPGGLLKCRLQVLLQGMWFPRGSGNLLTPSNMVLHTLACASHGQGLLLGTAVQGRQSEANTHTWLLIASCRARPHHLS